jgi:serine/threonine-protein kinase HipA
MACGTQGRFANAANLLSECRRYLLAPEDAAAIINEMEASMVCRGPRLRSQRGDCEAIRRAYVYRGFRG